MGERGKSGLFFENEAQRRIVEVLCSHPTGEVFLPYLEAMTQKSREELSCDLCKLEIAGLIEMDRSFGPDDTMFPFILPYICTPKGRMVLRVIHNHRL